MRKCYMIAALLVLAAGSQLSAQQPAERREPRVLNVTGTGTVLRQPDRAVLLVAVESRAANAQDAAQTNARKMDAVHAALRRVGIVAPKVQTTSYELRPEYARPEPRGQATDTPRVVGFVAVNMVRVEIDSIARVGSIIDATIAAGANRIANLTFELRDPEAARLDAIRLAVQKARAEAEAIAAAAGQKLGPPMSISSSSGWQPLPMMRSVEMGMVQGAPAPATPIESGNLSIVANVSITYTIENP